MAWNFNGSNTTITFGDNHEPSDVTIFCWAKLDSTTQNSWSHIWGKEYAATRASPWKSYALILDNTANPNKKIRFNIGNANINSTLTAADVSTNWFSAIGWRNGGGNEVGVRINATENTTTAQAISYSTGHILVGANNNSSPGEVLDGDVAECAIWNVALTAAERAILAAGYSPLFVSPANLLLYAPLIGRYNPEIDLIGALSGTLVNTPVNAAHPRIIYPSPAQIRRFTTAVAANLRRYTLPILGMG